jgi:flagellar motility protein MotE (MotC chaperone)
LETELRERAEELDQDLDKVRGRIAELRAELDQQYQAREEERRGELRRSITRQSLGIVFFVSGAILSILGNTSTC